jgi:hypothetical protein
MNFKKEMKTFRKTPQKTTALGLTGVFSQIFITLQHVQVGELFTYLSGLTYGDIFGMIGPLILFVWAIIHNEKE